MNVHIHNMNSYITRNEDLIISIYMYKHMTPPPSENRVLYTGTWFGPHPVCLLPHVLGPVHVDRCFPVPCLQEVVLCLSHISIRLQLLQCKVIHYGANLNSSQLLIPKHHHIPQINNIFLILLSILIDHALISGVETQYSPWPGVDGCPGPDRGGGLWPAWSCPHTSCVSCTL